MSVISGTSFTKSIWMNDARDYRIYNMRITKMHRQSQKVISKMHLIYVVEVNQSYLLLYQFVKTM